MQQKGKPLTYMVYEKIYADIINGVITSNDILSESSLVAQLNVSKSPVREALILLCEENVLHSIPRVGYKVVQILPSEVIELSEARYALESFMLRKSWSRMGDPQLELLESTWRLCKDEEKTNTSVQDNWQRNIKFHLMLASFADNDYLLSLLERTLRACARASTQYYFARGVPMGEADVHDDLLKALRQRNLDRTLTVLSKDVQQLIGPMAGI